jgi:hypothetical protein
VVITHCNAGCPVALPREKESVLLGAAVLGAVAAKKFVSIREAMMALNAPGLVSTILSDLLSGLGFRYLFCSIPVIYIPLMWSEAHGFI